jgi:hypothetical protein
MFSEITRQRIWLLATLGLGLILALLRVLGMQSGPALAAPRAEPAKATAELHVCPAGPPTCDYAIIQEAVDAADDGDVIKVAAGTYTDVNNYGGLAQVVYISKTVTLRGGYTTANWDTPDPEANPTTLDAQRQGRVVYVAGSPTLEGLRITGGDAAGLGGGFLPMDRDSGGGLYVNGYTPTISNNQVFGNTAEDGGGCLILGATSNATLNGNTVTNNTAKGYGGGLYLLASDAMLNGNSIISNTVWGAGGGLSLWFSDAVLNGNNVTSNTANVGGGLYLEQSNATLNGNTVSGNTAWQSCGGLLATDNSTLSGNLITGNTAYYIGGGLCLGGNARLTNNVVADNQANTACSGLSIASYDSPHLLHTTIHDNTGGDGSGACVSLNSNVAMTNTILVNQTVGITVAAGSTVELNGVLWYANSGGNTGGAGVVILSNAVTGDPAFDADGYHLTSDSAAIDAGVDAGVTDDIDGQVRPYNGMPDLGADEWLPPELTPTPTPTPTATATPTPSPTPTATVMVKVYLPILLKGW